MTEEKLRKLLWVLMLETVLAHEEKRPAMELLDTVVAKIMALTQPAD